jgi:hypothetical protein
MALELVLGMRSPAAATIMARNASYAVLIHHRVSVEMDSVAGGYHGLGEPLGLLGIQVVDVRSGDVGRELHIA